MLKNGGMREVKDKSNDRLQCAPEKKFWQDKDFPRYSQFNHTAKHIL